MLDHGMDDGTESRDEILIGRIVDREASAADWRELELAAGSDPEIWQRLAGSVLAECDLVRAGMEALSATEAVLLPAPPVRGRRPSWMGWAAALVLAAGWVTSTALSRAAPEVPAMTPVVSVPTTDAALQQYRDAARREGRLIEELPQLVLGTQVDHAANVVDVYYVRRFVERARLDQLYQIGKDDGGALTPLPVSLAELGDRAL